jgi:hypothetical protein
MRLAEHESEGDNEELLTEVVVDVQDPAPPIFEATRHGEGSHDTGRVITRLSEVIYHGAAAIDQDLLRVGAMEIHLVMFSLLQMGRLATRCQRRRRPRRNGPRIGAVTL